MSEIVDQNPHFTDENTDAQKISLHRAPTLALLTSKGQSVKASSVTPTQSQNLYT